MQQYTRVNSQFGIRVRQLREKQGGLIDQLAGESGVSRRTILRIENLVSTQTQRFYTANLHRIAKALGTTLDELFHYPTHQPGTNQEGWLVQDGEAISWIQHQKKYPVQSLAIVNHMKAHSMPRWSEWKQTDSMERATGPTFYTKNPESDGLLIKFSGFPTTFMIKDGHKHQFADEYSFDNYVHNTTVLDWSDIISVTEEIVNEFPRGERIELQPPLVNPQGGVSLNTPLVSLSCQPHPNPNWNYHFQIASDLDFRGLIDERTVPEPTIVVNNLSPCTYFWRVRGEKPGRIPSAWSEVWSFMVRSH